jgi:hypothetical protein
VSNDGLIICAECGRAMDIEAARCRWCGAVLGEHPPNGASGCLRALGWVGFVVFCTLLSGGVTALIVCRDQLENPGCGYPAGFGAILGFIAALAIAAAWRMGTGGWGRRRLLCPSCGRRTAPGPECQWCDQPLGGGG